jgi:hypothetical protein
MDVTFLLALVLFMAMFLGGRWVTAGAIRFLSTEEKAQLVDLSASLRKYTIPVAVLMIAVIFLLPILTIPAIVLYAVSAAGLVYSKVNAYGFPKSYSNRYLAGAFLIYGALVFFFIYIYIGRLPR